MFQFKQFTVHQDRTAMKVTTDACLFGAWVSSQNSVVSAHKILDIGTGTGLLSLMLAQKNPDAKIDAIEIDKDAAEQACDNVIHSPWNGRVNIIQADIRQKADSLPQYDIIISNPPFHEKQLASDKADKNTAHHSSELSLKELLRIISTIINTKGKFYLLLPYYRLEEAKKMIFDAGLYISTLVGVRQSVKHDFFRIMIEGNAGKQSAIQISDLSIWDDQQQYTPEFIELLESFYLSL